MLCMSLTLYKKWFYRYITIKRFVGRGLGYVVLISIIVFA